MSESEKPLAAAEAKRLDRISKSVLFQGASISQLGLLFGKDNRTVSLKLQGCEPCGKRAGFAIYRIRDAAPYLVTPVGDFEAYLKKMNHKDLPPALTKEYWQGQRARQQFEEEEGDLWRTDDVVAKFSHAFQSLRTSMLLFSDAVEREVAFTDHQRDLLKDLVDASLEEIRVNLIADFEGDQARESEQDGDAPGADAGVDADDPDYWNPPTPEDGSEGL